MNVTRNALFLLFFFLVGPTWGEMYQCKTLFANRSHDERVYLSLYRFNQQKSQIHRMAQMIGANVTEGFLRTVSAAYFTRDWTELDLSLLRFAFLRVLDNHLSQRGLQDLGLVSELFTPYFFGSYSMAQNFVQAMQMEIFNHPHWSTGLERAQVASMRSSYRQEWENNRELLEEVRREWIQLHPSKEIQLTETESNAILLYGNGHNVALPSLPLSESLKEILVVIKKRSKHVGFESLSDLKKTLTPE